MITAAQFFGTIAKLKLPKKLPPKPQKLMPDTTVAERLDHRFANS
jgi:hypothetical protein